MIRPLQSWLRLLCRGWTVGSQRECQRLGDLQMSRWEMGTQSRQLWRLREEKGLSSFWRSNKQDMTTDGRECEIVISFPGWLWEVNGILSFYGQGNRLWSNWAKACIPPASLTSHCRAAFIRKWARFSLKAAPQPGPILVSRPILWSSLCVLQKRPHKCWSLRLRWEYMTLLSRTETWWDENWDGNLTC